MFSRTLYHLYIVSQDKTPDVKALKVSDLRVLESIILADTTTQPSDIITNTGVILLRYVRIEELPVNGATTGRPIDPV